MTELEQQQPEQLQPQQPEQQERGSQAHISIEISPLGSGIVLDITQESGQSVNLIIGVDDAARIGFRLQALATILLHQNLMARMMAAEEARKSGLIVPPGV
jgi:hypothetical protein